MKITNRASQSSLQQLNLQSNTTRTNDLQKDQPLTMSGEKNKTMRSINEPIQQSHFLVQDP